MSYWRRVWHQACTETIAAADLRSRGRLAFTIVEILVTAAILFYVLGSLAVLDFLGTVGVSVVAFVGAICLLFLWHVISAPAVLARIDSAANESTARELRDLKRKLTPTFEVSAAATQGSGNYPCRVYLNVHNTGATEAKNARGRLIGIRHPSFAGEEPLDVPLAWEQPDNPSDKSRKSFYGSARLNVAKGGRSANWLVPEAAGMLDPEAEYAARFPRDDALLVEVEVTADGLPRTIGRFRLRWFSFVRLPDKDGAEQIFVLDSQNVEVEDLPSQSGAGPGAM
jgi:hypothetical protein